MKTKKFMIFVLTGVLIVYSVFADTEQTGKDHVQHEGCFEFCSTEKIIWIVLVFSLFVSLIFNVVCYVKNRKRDSSSEYLHPLVNNCDDIRMKFNAVGYVVEREWSSITTCQAKVTLNPDTASPSLIVSQDGSQVRFKGDGSAGWPSVLGKEGFTSGRHYWEVEVGEKGYWALGITTYLDEKSIPEKPEEGYWLLRLCRGNKYEAVSQSLVPLTLQRKLYKVGVYLDYKKGELSFYNVYDDSMRYEIHTFNYKFTEVYPIFSPGSRDRGPLKLN
ncbi:E3 ubiquitin-protein ligase TRIM39-like isoform X2 [Polyodon spathula]|uniref:E3 ubiquitin-protein ligase TRIM39-like isoform X2 n=1 Tax=Polyodon spathula TaxID=7913 RepID=UPI001B7EE3D9|nr:E3 ubiquitin-protein ligase TRIM39-like isoform X2 [Polyodon spathula]